MCGEWKNGFKKCWNEFKNIGKKIVIFLNRSVNLFLSVVEPFGRLA